MAVNEALVILKDAKEFTPEVAEFIVLEVAKGASVAELHEAYDDTVPNPIIVNRWRKNFPAFDQVMKEAEEAAADQLAFEVLKLADDEDKQAAQVRNGMDARKWLSSKLSSKWGDKGKAGGKGGVTINLGQRLTDDQLMQIAQGGMPALEGEFERKEK